MTVREASTGMRPSRISGPSVLPLLLGVTSSAFFKKTLN